MSDEYEKQRAKYRRVLDSSPLPADTKRELMATAQYMTNRLRGILARPPGHWTAEQIAAFAAVLADPEARAAALAWTLEGWRELKAKADALPD